MATSTERTPADVPDRGVLAAAVLLRSGRMSAAELLAACVSLIAPAAPARGMLAVPDPVNRTSYLTTMHATSGGRVRKNR